jgi:hypothetical protein
MSKGWLKYSFDNGHENGCSIRTISREHPPPPDFVPDPELSSIERNRSAVDFGLFTRVTNPFWEEGDTGSYVVIIAGCNLAGQIALTDWLDRPETLHRISTECEDSACQYVVRVEYHYENGFEPVVDKDSIEVVAFQRLSVPLPPLPSD